MEPDKVSKIKHKSYLNIPHTNIYNLRMYAVRTTYTAYIILYICPLLLSTARTEVKEIE